MRALTIGLVLLSVVFSAGGVAVVGRADSKTAPQQSVAPAPQPSQSAAPDPMIARKLPGQCAPLKPTRQPKLYRNQRQAQAAAFPKDAIPLNTRGYNYGDPDLAQLRPDAPPPAARPK